jgi:ribonuclease D
MNPSDAAPSPADPARTISREDLANLPIRRYEGEVCVVAEPHDVARALADIRQETVVGLDTETRPAFRKGEVHLPCLVQVATARTVYLFQLRRVDASHAIAEMLGEPHILKVGVALADDLRSLKKVFPFTEKSVLDLGIVARRAGFGQTGVRNLAGIFLGIRIPKGAKTTNWAVTHLTPQQIVYAATDAWVCRELYLSFREKGMIGSRAED